MKPKVLVPCEIAETCLLIKALLYRAVGRLPLQSIAENEIDQPDEEPDEPDIVLTPEECGSVGLPQDPEWEERQKREGERLRDQLVWAPADSAVGKRFYEQWTKWKAVKDHRQKEWHHKFQELLVPYQKQFQAALLDGRLGSEGQSSAQIEREMAEGARWWHAPYEAIPSTFWSSCEIDWEKSRAKGETDGYESIVVKTDDLFRVFPLRDPTPVGNVGKIGEYFVVSHDVAVANPGRPRKYPWDDLFLEMAKRVKDGSLPEKQDAFILEMEEWCRKNWVSFPGETSLKMKIMPFYHAFVRPNKVKK